MPRPRGDAPDAVSNQTEASNSGAEKRVGWLKGESVQGRPRSGEREGDKKAKLQRIEGLGSFS